MEHTPSDLLLVEAAMLITATRLRIAHSMTLLAKVTLDGVRAPRVAGSFGALASPGGGPPGANRAQP
jgi:hypothetical protein